MHKGLFTGIISLFLLLRIFKEFRTARSQFYLLSQIDFTCRFQLWWDITNSIMNITNSLRKLLSQIQWTPLFKEVGIYIPLFDQNKLARSGHTHTEMLADRTSKLEVDPPSKKEGRRNWERKREGGREGERGRELSRETEKEKEKERQWVRVWRRESENEWVEVMQRQSYFCSYLLRTILELSFTPKWP